MLRRFFTVSLFTLLVACLLGQEALMASRYKPLSLPDAPQNSADVAKIKAYHDEIDAWAKAHPTAVRYFASEGEITDDNKTIQHWKEYKTKKERPEPGNPLQTNANVWMKDGKVVAAILSTKSDHTSGSDGYYYRADGTLAYEEVHSYSVGYDPPFMWSKSYYSSDGKRISMTMLCSMDDKKWAPCKKDSGWRDSSGDEQMYKKNNELPFFNLLAKGQ
ncbi:MAG: hypothetical protein M3362_11190 [Acidobacteriota bacterium]|nr:hypothetical protein [Acidobacteriota bacterium]